jgi:hypothetical protein
MTRSTVEHCPRCQSIDVGPSAAIDASWVSIVCQPCRTPDYPPPCRIIDVQNPSTASELAPYYLPAIRSESDSATMLVVAIMLAAIGVLAIGLAIVIGVTLI